MDIIVVNGQPLYYTPKSLPADLQRDLEESGDLPLTEDQTRRLLLEIYKQQPYSLVVNAERFKERLTGAVAQKIAQGPKPQVLGHSSHSYQTDEAQTNLATNLDHIFGVPILKFPEIKFSYPVHIPEAKQGAYTAVMSNNPEVDYKSGQQNWELGPFFSLDSAESLNPAFSFIQHFMRNVDAATERLGANHPEINANLLKLSLIMNMVLELKLFDGTDAKQDLAATNYASSAYQEAYYNEFSGWLSPVNSFFGTDWGEAAWETTSGYSLPITSQGFGPLQIIPEEVQSALMDERVYQRYKDLLPERMCPHDVRAIVKACFDPQYMFILKAMVLDLQIFNIETVDGVEFPIDGHPYIYDRDESHQLAVMHGAIQLVQYPELANEIVTDFTTKDISPNILWYTAFSKIFNIPFDLETLMETQEPLPKGAPVGRIQLDGKSTTIWSRFPEDLQ